MLGGGSVATGGRIVPVQFEASLQDIGDCDQPAVAVSPDGTQYLASRTGATPSRIELTGYNPDGTWETSAWFSTGAASAQNPTVAVRRDGGIFVAFESASSPGDDADLAIVGYGPGVAMSQINTYTTGPQTSPDVATGADGSFVVVWQSLGSVGDDSSSASIQGRFVSPLGILGPQFQVNSHTPYAQTDPVVAARDGGFVVVWNGYSAHDTAGISARLLDADGTPLGSDLAINSTTASDQYHAAVAADESGGFAVAWSSNTSPGTDNSGSIQARFFASDGTPLSDQLQVNTTTTWSQHSPTIAPGGGGSFLIAWTSNDQAWPDSSSTGIRGRIMDLAGGQPADNDFQINAYTTSFQHAAAAAADREGNYVVSWMSDGSPGGATFRSIQLRRLIGASTDHQDGPVAYWNFDESSGTTLYDQAGSLDGVVHGAESTFLAKFRRALEFDPIAGDWVDLSAVGPEHAIDGPGVTVTAWVRLDLLPSEIAEAYAGIFDSWDDNYVLYLDKAAQELRFKVTTSTPGAERPGIPENALRTGRWSHVAGVYDGVAGEARIYLDGVLQDTHALSGTVRGSPEQIPAFGRNGGSGTGTDQFYFDGAIDDASIWDRALSTDEVRYLHSNALFCDGFEYGLYLWSESSSGT